MQSETSNKVTQNSRVHSSTLKDDCSNIIATTYMFALSMILILWIIHLS